MQDITKKPSLHIVRITKYKKCWLLECFKGEVGLMCARRREFVLGARVLVLKSIHVHVHVCEDLVTSCSQNGLWCLIL